MSVGSGGTLLRLARQSGIDRAVILGQIIWCLAHPVAGAAQNRLRLIKDANIASDATGLSVIGRLMVSVRGIAAVGQPQELKIRFFDAKGRTLGSFGRKGEGPGEFQRLGSMQWRGDTLCIIDPQLSRMTFVGPDMKLIRVLPLPRTLAPSQGGEGSGAHFGSLLPRALLSNGLILVTPLLPRQAAIPSWLPSIVSNGSSFLQVTADGRFQRLIAVRARGEACDRDVMENDGRAISVSIPFCGDPAAATGNDGRVVFVNRMAGTGAQGKFRVVAFNGQRGDTIFDRSYSYDLIPIPARIVDSVHRNVPAFAAGRPNLGKVYRSLPLPKHFPPTQGSIMVGTDGSVWLEDGNPMLPVRRWRILRSDGVEIGMVEVARNIALVAVLRDTAWGVETDDDGVESLWRFTVR